AAERRCGVIAAWSLYGRRWEKSRRVRPHRAGAWGDGGMGDMSQKALAVTAICRDLVDDAAGLQQQQMRETPPELAGLAVAQEDRIAQPQALSAGVVDR